MPDAAGHAEGAGNYRRRPDERPVQQSDRVRVRIGAGIRVRMRAGTGVRARARVGASRLRLGVREDGRPPAERLVSGKLGGGTEASRLGVRRRGGPSTAGRHHRSARAGRGQLCFAAPCDIRSRRTQDLHRREARGRSTGRGVDVNGQVRPFVLRSDHAQPALTPPRPQHQRLARPGEWVAGEELNRVALRSVASTRRALADPFALVVLALVASVNGECAALCVADDQSRDR